MHFVQNMQNVYHHESDSCTYIINNSNNQKLQKTVLLYIKSSPTNNYTIATH